MRPYSRRGHRGVLAVSASLLILVSCGGCEGEKTPRAEVHPREELMESTRADVPLTRVRFEDLRSRTSPLARRLGRFPDQGVLGAGGAADSLLGEILDAVITPRGEVALLDGSFGIVRVYSERGPALATLGGFGEGPGEFQEPTALALLGGDTLLVSDAWLSIHRFVRTEDGWSFRDRTGLAFQAEDLCGARGAIVVQGPRLVAGERSAELAGLETLHRIDETGEVQRSWGIAYHSPSRIAASTLSRGRIACEPATGRTWVAYRTLGEVHAFDGNGRLLWVTRLEDFEYPPLIEVEGGAIRPDMTAVMRIEVVSNLTLLGDMVLAVSVESRRVADIEGGRARVERRVYLLDARSGGGLGAFAGHAVLGGSSSLAVLYRETPVPEVAVVRVADGDRGR